jgi:hypothetical protein
VPQTGSDETDVPDECRLYRLVRPDWIKADGERPTSQAFADHPSDGAMSVYLADEMERAGVTVDDLLARWEGYSVCWFTAGELRKLGQIVSRDADGVFPGHGAVRDRTGRRSARTRSDLARLARWHISPG